MVSTVDFPQSCGYITCYSGVSWHKWDFQQFWIRSFELPMGKYHTQQCRLGCAVASKYLPGNTPVLGVNNS